MHATAAKLIAFLMVCHMGWLPGCHGEEVLFEDHFEHELSDKWKIVGLEKDDYRIHEGALELRIKSSKAKERRPMLKVDLPFTTEETVVASVNVTVPGDPLKQGDAAGLCLTKAAGSVFSVRKTNIDGYFLLAPGEVNFIGTPGQEGDPGKYAVKYWPADEAFGPLRIIVRGHYVHFQVGPSSDGNYRTFFHSAIQKLDDGLGFGLSATGDDEGGPRWVRFDNFRVVKN